MGPRGKLRKEIQAGLTETAAQKRVCSAVNLCQLIRLARLKTQLLLSVTQHQLPVPPRKRGLKLNLHRHRKRSPPKRRSPFPRKVGGVRCAMMVITAIWKRRPRLLQPAMRTVQLTRDVPVNTNRKKYVDEINLSLSD